MTRGPAKSFDPDRALLRAVDVFWSRGYAAAGLGDLLAAMGIARKSLYDTYGSKRQLYLRALEAYSIQQVATMRATLDAPGSPRSRLRRLLRERQHGFPQPGSRGCLLGGAAAQAPAEDVELQAALRRHFRRIEDLFCDALGRAKAAAELAAGAEPRALARLLVAALQGLAVLGRVDEGPAFARHVIDEVLRAIG
jgi:TetR/AcrR family transcriptional repressor of nem operon